ncbi:MAG: hypothetical protein CM15mV42_2010 [uncultured marine virus]|nr:MAG: hypothetical protein CM15mV42_2010 [uncultured marine virus]
MNITIKNQDGFVLYNNEIHITLFPNEECVHIFSPEIETYKSVDHEEVSSVREENLVNELLENYKLRTMAWGHGLIDIDNFDRIGYLNYVQSFN